MYNIIEADSGSASVRGGAGRQWADNARIITDGPRERRDGNCLSDGRSDLLLSSPLRSSPLLASQGSRRTTRNRIASNSAECAVVKIQFQWFLVRLRGPLRSDWYNCISRLNKGSAAAAAQLSHIASHHNTNDCIHSISTSHLLASRRAAPRLPESRRGLIAGAAI